MEIKNVGTIGGRLKELRLKAGISQEQLAKELHFGSKSMVSQYESNKRSITIDALLEYSGRFNVTTDWILKGVLAPMLTIHEDVEEVLEYEELRKTFAGIKDPQMRQIALEQLRVLLNNQG